MDQSTYDRCLKDGACVFETRGRTCRLAVTPGGNYCPRHRAMLDAQADHYAGKQNVTARKHREKGGPR